MNRATRAMATAIMAALPLTLTATFASAAAAGGTTSARTRHEPALQDHVHVDGSFLTPGGNATNAYTYDTGKVPAGARASVDAVSTGSGATALSMVSLRVYGLIPNHDYGAHVHYLACGPSGADAGAHYQNVLDPAVGGDRTRMSNDPAYANPRNEVWLDFTTDSWGNGRARTAVNWHFRAGDAHSVVIHDHHTGHGGVGNPPAGDAGSRLACLTVPF